MQYTQADRTQERGWKREGSRGRQKKERRAKRRRQRRDRAKQRAAARGDCARAGASRRERHIGKRSSMERMVRGRVEIRVEKRWRSTWLRGTYVLGRKGRRNYSEYMLHGIDGDV